MHCSIYKEDWYHVIRVLSRYLPMGWYRCGTSGVYVRAKLTLLLINIVYIIWMWIDWYRKYQPAEPEYEVCWRVSEANESQTSYFVEQTDIFQYQSYSHSDDIFIILKSTINTDTSIFVHVFSLEKLHDSKYWKYTSLKP